MHLSIDEAGLAILGADLFRIKLSPCLTVIIILAKFCLFLKRLDLKESVSGIMNRIDDINRTLTDIECHKAFCSVFVERDLTFDLCVQKSFFMINLQQLLCVFFNLCGFIIAGKELEFSPLGLNGSGQITAGQRCVTDKVQRGYFCSWPFVDNISHITQQHGRFFNPHDGPGEPFFLIQFGQCVHPGTDRKNIKVIAPFEWQLF